MIVLFGVVGSGKSEQASRLVAGLHCPHVSTSRLLKQHPTAETEAIMLAGKLVDDQTIFQLLDPELKRIGAATNEFILDGAPRSIGQADWLINKVKAGEIKLTAIIHLKVSRETTLARLLARGREDDKEEVISERFAQYQKVTLPVLQHFRAKGFEVNDIDGEWSSDVVERQIWNVLKDKVETQKR